MLNFEKLPQNKPSQNSVSEGRYVAEIFKTQMLVSKTTNNEYLNVSFKIDGGGFDQFSASRYYLAVHIVRTWVNIFKRILRDRVPRDVHAVALFSPGHMPIVDRRYKVFIMLAVMNHRFTIETKGLRNHLCDLTQIVEHFSVFHVMVHPCFFSHYIIFNAEKQYCLYAQEQPNFFGFNNMTV